ncbi:MAG: hypothetical protein HY347_09260 [candidate division NC10 bacterium]|nr:hypothetical protein [candidate division NC10 bacterium]
MAKEYRPIDLGKIKTYPLQERFSKMTLQDEGQAWRPGGTFKAFLATLPNILAGKEFRGLVQAIVGAKQKGKPVIVGLGGHVIKVGLSPILIDLMEKGIVSALALHGAGAVHDFELAFLGRTSEDVEAALADGTFGMAEETGRLINEAIKDGIEKGWGFGHSLGEKLFTLNPPHLDRSLFAAGARLHLPVTVHVALGTDIFQMHPSCDGRALGEATHRDFRLLASVVADLGDGGVYLNLGSAVILPEVFLKALTVARNLGHPVKDFVTANLDFLQHYRPTQNVVRRPVAAGGTGYSLTGHHELLVPLLAAAVLEELG